MGALRAGSALTLTGIDCGRGAGINMFVRAANFGAGGTYPMGDGDGSVHIDWTPDARTSTAANEMWSAPGMARVVNNVLVRGGSGSLTISSISAEWVSGSFSFEVVPSPSNRDTGTKMLQGNFELSFRQRTLC
jgi:hypothetical protein